MLMIVLPGFMVYCAFATESTFWGCIGLAVLFLVVFVSFLIKALKNNQLAKMTFSCNKNNIINQTPHRINSISLNEAFYSMEIMIPFYVGKGKIEVSYVVYTKTQESPAAFSGYYGLHALKQFHEAGAVLIPKDACVKTTN